MYRTHPEVAPCEALVAEGDDPPPRVGVLAVLFVKVYGALKVF